MHDIAAFFAIMSTAALTWACWWNTRSKHSMTPKQYTVLSAVGPHAAVVLYPQPFGKGIDREGNTYRIVGDTAHLIEE